MRTWKLMVQGHGRIQNPVNRVRSCENTLVNPLMPGGNKKVTHN